ncbi:MAG: glucose-1-phosphate adenylyltransferase [Spirochaetales bacterium]|jgi:glucose-1-phosphate adenylyltransferase|nr:glucose-1-phosphate adenylyltransferase [Spirochaetales bacterium]
MKHASNNVLTIVLGGGKGSRLYPLTRDRAKPAVPFGAKYRIVDIPLSNSINAGFKQIYILTQFNSASLHMHIANLYAFDAFTKGFVEILAAEQTFESQSWYEGTADAVRKNFIHFREQNPTYYIILSGDQLYRMDLADFLRNHIKSGAEISIAATVVDRKAASGFGILQTDKSGRIQTFTEKPAPEEDIDNLKISPELHPDKEQLHAGKEYMASMGIYIFNANVLDKMLDNTMADFGKEIIPAALDKHKVQVYVFTGFWEDIGTIKSFYDTNLNLSRINPDFNFYEENRPIYTTDNNLPPSKFNFSTLSEVLTGDGCIITKSMITRSVISIRSIIETGANLEGVITMGADFYETPEDKIENRKRGRPDIGIGRNTQVRNAIIDKNSRIGDGCLIGVQDIPRRDGDYDGYYIRDGIIIIPKGGILQPGTVI